MPAWSHDMNPIAPTAAIIIAVLPSIAAGQIENTALVGQWNGGAPDADIWAEGEYAYMGQFGQSAVSIIDISVPGSPSLAVEYQLPAPWAGASATSSRSTWRGGSSARRTRASRASSA